MQNEAGMLINRLMGYYGVSSSKKLSKTLGLSAAAISRWKKFNYVNAIKKKCKELGIYREIFENSETSIVKKDLTLEDNTKYQNKKIDDDILQMVYVLNDMANIFDKKKELKDEFKRLMIQFAGEE